MSYDLELAIDKLLAAEAEQEEMVGVRGLLADWREQIDELRSELEEQEQSYREAEARVIETEKRLATEADRAREQIDLATTRAISASEPHVSPSADG